MDTRFFKSMEFAALSVPLVISTYCEGYYELYLKITDTSIGEQVLMANTLPSTADGYLLGFLQVGK